MLPSEASYEADFHAWAHEQAALLRAGRVAELGSRIVPRRSRRWDAANGGSWCIG